jgi:antitoxin CcdA
MSAKKAVNLSLDGALLDKARAEKINLSAALERTIRAEVSNIEAKRWQHENADAIAALKRTAFGLTDLGFSDAAIRYLRSKRA